MTLPQTQINWQQWLQRWDAQQTGYLPNREARFTAMFDVLEVLMPPDFVAIDLACGPGSLSQRLLRRFPQAKCIAIDFDPILLSMGQAVLRDGNGRLKWLEADLRGVDLINLVAEFVPPDFSGAAIDAVLSTTALHWLPTTRLLEIYQQLGSLIRPGGVFLNGDNICFSPSLPTFQQISDSYKQHQEQVSFIQNGVETWEQWWEAITQESMIADLLKERHHRFRNRIPEEYPSYELHRAALESSSFSEVGTIWQQGDDRIIMAVR